METETEDTDWVDRVLRTDSVGDEEPDDLDGREARIAEAREDGVDSVRRERDEVRRGRLGVVGAAGEERELGAAVAVCHPNGACELDAIIKHISVVVGASPEQEAHKSPKETLCLIANGREASTISSRPWLAGYVSSTSECAMIEPSVAICSI